jgi:hypothetical protein
MWQVVADIHQFAACDMKRFCFATIVIAVVLLTLAGCGDNLAGPVTSASAPRNLKALSVNESTVFLQWNAPADADSAFGGYRLEYGSAGIELSKNQLSYSVTSLQPGEQEFTVYSLKSNGARADGSTIRWAPATRFDSTYALLEYIAGQPVRQSGINLGAGTALPFTLEVNTSAANVLDLYLHGGDGNSQQPLALYAASRFDSGFRQTLFSTVTNSSASLDLPLAAFPADTTFVSDSVRVTDNTIFYVRIRVNNVEVHFARLHVRLRAGTTYPDRVIELHISLQRLAGLQFAVNADRDNSSARPGTVNMRLSHS